MDYKELCLKLFGTTDTNELKKISEEYKAKSRNAGRKPQFSKSEVKNMKKLQQQGLSQTQIAKKYNTSRQTISKYLTAKLKDGYTMQIDLMFKHSICTTIFVNFLDKKIKIQNYTNDLLHRAFGINERPTFEDFEEFIKDRCFQEERGDIKSILKLLELDNYDPLQIIEKTHGKTAEDNLWMKFKYLERSPQ